MCCYPEQVSSHCHINSRRVGTSVINTALSLVSLGQVSSRHLLTDWMNKWAKLKNVAVQLLISCELRRGGGQGQKSSSGDPWLAIESQREDERAPTWWSRSPWLYKPFAIRESSRILPALLKLSHNRIKQPRFGMPNFIPGIGNIKASLLLNRLSLASSNNNTMNGENPKNTNSPQLSKWRDNKKSNNKLETD